MRWSVSASKRDARCVAAATAGGMLSSHFAGSGVRARDCRRAFLFLGASVQRCGRAGAMVTFDARSALRARRHLRVFVSALGVACCRWTRDGRMCRRARVPENGRFPCLRIGGFLGDRVRRERRHVRILVSTLRTRGRWQVAGWRRHLVTLAILASTRRMRSRVCQEPEHATCEILSVNKRDYDCCPH